MFFLKLSFLKIVLKKIKNTWRFAPSSILQGQKGWGQRVILTGRPLGAPFTRTRRSCQCDEWRCKWLVKGKQSGNFLNGDPSRVLHYCLVQYSNYFVQPFFFLLLNPQPDENSIPSGGENGSETFFIFSCSSWKGREHFVRRLFFSWFLLSAGSLPTAEVLPSSRGLSYNVLSAEITADRFLWIDNDDAIVYWL